MADNGFDHMQNTQGPPSGPPPIEVDITKYARHLEGMDLTQSQKHDLLQELWNIVTGFVQLGWGLTAPDYIEKLADLPPENAASAPENCAISKPDMVQSKHSKSPKPQQFDASLRDAFGKGVT